MKPHLMAWGTGISSAPSRLGRTVVLESPDHLSQLLDTDLLDGVGTKLFIPSCAGDAPPGAVRYEGSARDPGAEFSVGNFYLQIQGYAMSAFMSAAGPTLVRVNDSDDLHSFVTDADRALETGAFTDFLVNPAVHLADRPGLAGSRAAAGPSLRVNIDAAGNVSTSPAGTTIGTAGSSMDALDRRWRELNEGHDSSCLVALGAVLTVPQLRDALDARPWLGRYLRAITALQGLIARGIAGARVAGFGRHLAEGLEDDERDVLSGDGMPLVLWTAETAFITDGSSGRVFETSLKAARLIDVLTTVGPETAAAHCGRANIDQAAEILRRADINVPTVAMETAG